MSVDVKIVRQAAITSGSLQSFVAGGIGGKPKAAMFFCNLATGNLAVADAVMSVGITDGTRQFAMVNSSDDNVPTSVCSHRISNTNCIVMLDAASRLVGAEASFSKWVDGGVEINWTDLFGTAIMVTCVLFFGEGLSVYVGDHIKSTTDTVITAPNFWVDQVFWFASGITTYDSTDNPNAFSKSFMGFADRTGANNYGIYPVTFNGQGLSNSESSIVSNLNEPDVSPIFSLKDYTSQGFTARGDTSSPAAQKVCYLALGYGVDVDHWTGIVDTKTVSGNGVHTEPGFKPQFVMHLLSPLKNVNLNADNTLDGAGSVGIGVFTATDASNAIVTDEDGADIMDTESRGNPSPGACRRGDKAVIFLLTYVSMDTVGWTNSYSLSDASGPRKWPTLVIGVNKPSVIIPRGIIPGGIIP